MYADLVFKGIDTDTLTSLLAGKRDLAREAQADGARNTLARVMRETLQIQRELDERAQLGTPAAYWGGSAGARW